MSLPQDAFASVSQALFELQCENKLEAFKVNKLNDIRFKVSWVQTAAKAESVIPWDDPDDCTAFISRLRELIPPSSFSGVSPANTAIPSAAGMASTAVPPPSSNQSNHRNTSLQNQQNAVHCNTAYFMQESSKPPADAEETKRKEQKDPDEDPNDNDPLKFFFVHGVKYRRYFHLEPAQKNHVDQVINGKFRKGVTFTKQASKEKVIAELYDQLESKTRMKCLASCRNGVEELDDDTKRHQDLVRLYVQDKLQNNKHYEIRKERGTKTPSECCRQIKGDSDDSRQLVFVVRHDAHDTFPGIDEAFSDQVILFGERVIEVPQYSAPTGSAIIKPIYVTGSGYSWTCESNVPEHQCLRRLLKEGNSVSSSSSAVESPVAGPPKYELRKIDTATIAGKIKEGRTMFLVIPSTAICDAVQWQKKHTKKGIKFTPRRSTQKAQPHLMGNSRNNTATAAFPSANGSGKAGAGGAGAGGTGAGGAGPNTEAEEEDSLSEGNGEQLQEEEDGEEKDAGAEEEDESAEHGTGKEEEQRAAADASSSASGKKRKQDSVEQRKKEGQKKGKKEAEKGKQLKAGGRATRQISSRM